MKTNFRTPIPKTLIAFFSLSLVALSFSACTKSDSIGTTPTTTVKASAFVMAANTLEGSDAQDVYVDGNKVSTSAVAYTQATAYVDVKAGDHQLQFKTNSTTTVNSTAALTAADNSYYTVFYASDKTAVTVKDDHTAPKSGKARVRFINLSSALASNVDFGLSATNKLVTGLAYKAASAYNEVDAATKFSLYIAGSTDVKLDIPVTIQAGHIYTIYVSGATTATLKYNLLVQD